MYASSFQPGPLLPGFTMRIFIRVCVRSSVRPSDKKYCFSMLYYPLPFCFFLWPASGNSDGWNDRRHRERFSCWNPPMSRYWMKSSFDASGSVGSVGAVQLSFTGRSFAPQKVCEKWKPSFFSDWCRRRFKMASQYYPLIRIQNPLLFQLLSHR